MTVNVCVVPLNTGQNISFLMILAMQMRSKHIYPVFLIRVDIFRCLLRDGIMLAEAPTSQGKKTTTTYLRLSVCQSSAVAK